MIENGQQVQIVYVAEDVEGTTPDTPALKILRTTSRNINLTKGSIVSNEVRKSRQRKDVRHGMRRVDGTLGFEMSLMSYDDLLEAALGGSWTAVTTSGSPSLSAASGTNTFTRSAGSFLTDGFRPGDIITTTGFTTPANNGTFRITSLTATAITVDGTLATDASTSGPTLVLAGKRLDVGLNMKTFTFERQFLTALKYQAFRGVAVNGFTLSVQPEQMVSGNWTLLGLDADEYADASVGGAPSVISSYDPITSFEGDIYENGVKIATVTALDFTYTNNRTVSGVVGSKVSPQIFEGTAGLTGNVSAYFTDEALFDRFSQESDSKLWVKLDDPDGNGFLNIVVPIVKYTGNNIDPPAEGGVVQAMPFTALEDAAASGTTISIQRSNA